MHATGAEYGLWGFFTKGKVMLMFVSLYVQAEPHQRRLHHQLRLDSVYSRHNGRIRVMGV